MTIPALPPLDRTSPTFRSDLDTFFLTQLPDTVDALNAEFTRIDGITAAGFTGTSGTSRTIASSGSFTFGVTSGTTKAFTPGQRLVIAAMCRSGNVILWYIYYMSIFNINLIYFKYRPIFYYSIIII
jgi:hypothetical protein